MGNLGLNKIGCFYKFLKKNHAISFLKTGELRIGTLFEYRRIESHGTEIGDEKEGTKETICMDSIDSVEELNRHPFLSKFIHAEPGAKISIHGAKFVSNEESKNYFIFSMSESIQSAVAKKMGYDSCLQINRPLEFLSILDSSIRKLEQLEEFYLVERCVYVSRVQLFDQKNGIIPDSSHQAHPALMKDPKYSYQKEVRVIWEPKTNNIRPLILKCPKVVGLCELVDIPLD